MEEQEILGLVRHNQRLYTERKEGLMRGIKHPRNPGKIYYPKDWMMLKCDDGEWRPCVVYVSKKFERYARRADQFEKFEVAHD